MKIENLLIVLLFKKMFRKCQGRSKSTYRELPLFIDCYPKGCEDFEALLGLEEKDSKCGIPEI